MPTKNKPAKCRVPACVNRATRRGLCNSHYVSCCQMIGNNKTTWAELEAHGKVLPSRAGKGNSWILDFKKDDK